MHNDKSDVWVTSVYAQQNSFKLKSITLLLKHPHWLPILEKVRDKPFQRPSCACLCLSPLHPIFLSPTLLTLLQSRQASWKVSCLPDFKSLFNVFFSNATSFQSVTTLQSTSNTHFPYLALLLFSSLLTCLNILYNLLIYYCAYCLFSTLYPLESELYKTKNFSYFLLPRPKGLEQYLTNS